MAIESGAPIKSEELAALVGRVHARIAPERRIASIEVEFRPFANANSFIRMQRGELALRVADLLRTAPVVVLEALATILISKLYRKPVPAGASRQYRSYLRRVDVADHLAGIKRERGRKQILPPQGRHYDLIALFEKLNVQYFGGMMSRPELGWSRRASRTHLGHYDPVHHTIVLSAELDTDAIVPVAVEYVLYHEMLHLRFPVEVKNGRRTVHGPAFRQEERRFAGYDEAREALRRFAHREDPTGIEN
jgi:hypothetical protein